MKLCVSALVGSASLRVLYAAINCAVESAIPPRIFTNQHLVYISSPPTHGIGYHSCQQWFLSIIGIEFGDQAGCHGKLDKEDNGV